VTDLPQSRETVAVPGAFEEQEAIVVGLSA
jgi:hypothetical protein